MSRKNKVKSYSVDKIRLIHARAYAPWAKEEDEELRRCAHLPIRALVKKFGRNRGAIRSRLKKLGLGAASREPASRFPQPLHDADQLAGHASCYRTGPWTDDEDETVRRFANRTVPELAEMLHRHPGSVEARLYKLGLYARNEAPTFRTPAPTVLTARSRFGPFVIGAILMGMLIVIMLSVYLLSRERSTVVSATRAVNLPTKSEPLVVRNESCLWIATWNVRGYPETAPKDIDWFSHQLAELQADVLCVQEIASEARVATFLANHSEYENRVFVDSHSVHDNAIFATETIILEGLDVPDGFLHPPQVAYVARDGFDAVIVTLHLAWEPTERRYGEMRLLGPLVRDLLAIDPDVMLVGDFNLLPGQAQALAGRLGMTVLLGRNQSAVGTMFSGNSYDYFFISPDLAEEEAQGAAVVTFDRADLEAARRVSDHMPVLGFFSCDERFRDRPTYEQSNE